MGRNGCRVGCPDTPETRASANGGHVFESAPAAAATAAVVTAARGEGALLLQSRLRGAEVAAVFPGHSRHTPVSVCGDRETNS